MQLTNKAQLNELLRGLPQVEAVLTEPGLADTLARFRRDVVKRLVQDELASARAAITAGKSAAAPTAAKLAAAVAARLAELSTLNLRRVVNATGVLLHTNLGRAILSAKAQQALHEIAACYNNLEFDLETGGRSQRDLALEQLLVALTGCEAATVVNNNAAAVFIVLNTLAAGREVITSRGELVEIGGSFRVPDVVASSGCTLVEVGTTNRTRFEDFERAITERTAVLLKTHTSNFRVRGFTEEATQAELGALGGKHGIPVFNDLGSGYIEPEGGSELPEPGVLESLKDLPDVLSFSGDKLLGGPQAGIIIGKQDIIKRLRRNPLWRVLRIDKFTASALAATLAEHLQRPEHGAAGIAALLANHNLAAQEQQAEQLALMLRQAQPEWLVEVVDGTGTYGGGSLPDESIPAKLVRIKPDGMTAEQLDAQLRHGTPAVSGYVQQGWLVLNMLALLEGDEARIAARCAAL